VAAGDGTGEYGTTGEPAAGGDGAQTGDAARTGDTTQAGDSESGRRGGWRPGRGRATRADRTQADLESMSPPDPRYMLEVRDLRVHFPTDDGLVKAVDGISFRLERGRTLGIVGESGSGKSVTSLAIMGMHHGGSAKLGGQIYLDGEELVGADPARVRRLRGSKMAMIFQDPLSALHPYYTVGHQIAEAYLVHNKVSKKAAKAHAVEMLDRVGIPNPQARFPIRRPGWMTTRISSPAACASAR